jgi:translation initiation factor 3 subunit B
MAPSFSQLDPEVDYDDDDDVDFSDLREQYEVRMEEGLDTFIVVDGLPRVPPGSKDKLIKYFLKRAVVYGKVKEDDVYMPMNEAGDMSQGFAFVEYETAAQAAAAVKGLHATALDKKHTIAVNKLTDIERYAREGRIDEEYTAPEIPPFEEKEHLRSWLGDSDGRDQFVMFRGEQVSHTPHNAVCADAATSSMESSYCATISMGALRAGHALRSAVCTICYDTEHGELLLRHHIRGSNACAS